jgi:uncharacterized protein YndB with AHSA1/START domain
MTNASTTETSLQVSRVINAPREKVYNAFLDRASLTKWYHPGAMTTKVHTLEPREGGAFRISMTATEGEMAGTHTCYGTFLELRPHERIVHSWIWEGPAEVNSGRDSKVTLLFKETGGRTEVTLRHDGLPHAQGVQNHLPGWTGILENLAHAF